MIMNYIFILVGLIIYYGSFIMLILTNNHIFWLGILGLELHNKYSLKIREKGDKKPISFSLAIFIAVLITYLYVFNKYSIVIFSFDGILIIFSLLAYIYIEYTFYTYPLNKLYRRYKEWKWK